MPFWLACVLLLAAAAGIVCFARASSMNRPVRIVLLVLLSVMAALLLASFLGICYWLAFGKF